MKDLLKICRRYIMTAILTVCLVLGMNILFFFVYLVRENMYKADESYYSWRIARLSESLVWDGDEYALSAEAAVLSGGCLYGPVWQQETSFITGKKD